ncbi:hypothetical protein ACFFUT_14030 [Pseudohalocynthiibacter aestuariivivens]|jgi:hypothetical protein|uniref:SRPBCC family protein n=1 Tax=Pseudohalocynthiibacter aestuariivivens TaxID=1591409 RepID=A0ABV5JHF4_9RHOB|nr:MULTISPECIES: hypothetical protein [Pseudohalocynthiibacter]MBS9715391.1 hypothetical protein [Pseudohalocynthiibacter aestuariivivens]MCK0102663.1 hypothetical protein [Pseudohalocynthiibacter sp. F2068]
MVETTLTHTRTSEGVWEGLLVMGGDTPPVPELKVTHLEKPIPEVSLTENPEKGGEWVLSFPIPVECLSDGVQTFLITDTRSGARLGSYTIVTGMALEDDFRAEVDLLRAELDMLKRAFRRHCLETVG